MNWIFLQVWTGFLQATKAVKIQFKLRKKIQFIKLEISNSIMSKIDCRLIGGLDYFIPTLAVKSVWNLHNPGYISEGAHQWLLHRKTILSKRELYLGIVKVCKPVPISYEKAKNHTTLVKLPIFQPPKPISPLNLVRHLENPQICIKISYWYFDGKVKRILK